MSVDDDEEKDVKNKDNDKGTNNYDKRKTEQDIYGSVGSYKESPATTPRRRLQNPQHVKLMVSTRFTFRNH